MSVLLIKNVAATRIISLNRPESRNALNNELRKALLGAFEQAEADESVRVVILTGKGKSFCSGLDLKDLKGIRSKSKEQNLADSKALAELFKLIYKFPKPVIAAVNGHAIAGGAGLASVADIAVMSSEAKLGYTEARIGFVAALVAVFLLRQVGEKQAKELLLSARLIDAKKAVEIGLINEVVSPEHVFSRSLEIAKELSGNAPSSLKTTKQLLLELQNLDLEQGLNLAIKTNAESRGNTDLIEGINSFLEKRLPNWQLNEKD